MAEYENLAQMPADPSTYQRLVQALEGARNFLGGDPTIGGGLSLAMSAIPGGPKLPPGLGTFMKTQADDVAKSATNFFHSSGQDIDKAIKFATNRLRADSPVVAQLQAWKTEGFVPAGAAARTTRQAREEAVSARQDARLRAQDVAEDAAQPMTTNSSARLDQSVFDVLRRKD